MKDYVYSIKKIILTLFFLVLMAETAIAAYKPVLSGAGKDQQKTESVLSLFRVMGKVVPAHKVLKRRENHALNKGPARNKSTAAVFHMQIGSENTTAVAKKQQLRWDTQKLKLLYAEDYRKWKRSQFPFFKYLIYLYILVSLAVIWRMRIFKHKLF